MCTACSYNESTIKGKMGNSFSLSKRNSVCAWLIGLDAAGKTTMLHALCERQGGEIRQLMPSIGFHLEVAEMNDGTNVLNLDVGRNMIWGLMQRFYPMCNCLIFMVDANDHVRLPQKINQENKWWKTESTAKQILQKSLSHDEEVTADWPLLVIASKQDLSSAMSIDEVANGLGLREVEDWGQRGLISFLMGTHRRVGVGSVLQRLSNPGCVHLRGYIWSFVTLQKITSAAWLKGRPWKIVPASVYDSPEDGAHMSWMRVEGAESPERDEALRRAHGILGYNQAHEGLQWLKTKVAETAWGQDAQFKEIFKKAFPMSGPIVGRTRC